VPVLLYVRSKVSGAFYTSPSPEAKAFVEVGEKVKFQEKLFVLEMMKTFTSVSWSSELWSAATVVYANGGKEFKLPQTLPVATVRKVCATSGTAISPGTPLFELEIEGEEPSVASTSPTSSTPLPTTSEDGVMEHKLSVGGTPLLIRVHRSSDTPGAVLLEIKVPEKEPPPPPEPKREIVKVLSPRVGWYHFWDAECGKPKPYVQIGETVEEGRVLCRISTTIREKRADGGILSWLIPGRRVSEEHLVTAPIRGIIRARNVEQWNPASGQLAFLGGNVLVLQNDPIPVGYSTLLFEIEQTD
jgi:biotin carboxyl carrier protein